MAAVNQMAAGHRLQLYVACAILLLVSILEGSITVILITIFTNIVGASGLPPAMVSVAKFFGITSDPGLNVDSLIVLIAGMFLREAVYGAARSYVYLITPAIISDIRDRILANLLGARFSYLDRFESGTFRQVLTNECGRSVVAAQAIIFLIGNLMSVLMALSIMIYMSPPLTAIVATFAIILLPARLLYAKILHKVESRSLEKTFDLHNLLQEIVTNIRLIKLIGLTKKFAQETYLVSIKTLWLRAYSILMRTWDPMIINLLAFMVIGGILFSNEIYGYVETAYLLSFFIVVYRFVPPVNAVSASINQVVTNEPHVLATLKFFRPDTERMERSGGTELPAGPINKLTLRNLTFSYHQDSPALHDVSLESHRGEITAIVGASGSGKSSIVNLVLGMYERDSGEILLSTSGGERDIDAYSLSSLRRQIGVITQDATILNTSVFDVIRSGDKTISKEDVVAAARRADAHDFIESLPKGYDTMVGERGVMLSGGQRQRILIAQILVLHTPVLILDEATSALDVTSEREIHRMLQERKGDCLIIVITHRLSSLQDFDNIHVMENGRLRESGSWPQLMNLKGALYNMADDK